MNVNSKVIFSNNFLLLCNVYIQRINLRSKDLGIILGILLAIIDFALALFFIKKAIKKPWDTFYKTLIISLLLRLVFILICVFLIIRFTDFGLTSFLISLFTGIFILKIIEILYIHYNLKA